MSEAPIRYSWVAIDKNGYPYAFITDDISDCFSPSMSAAERKKQSDKWRREVVRFVADAVRAGDDARRVGGEELSQLLEQHIAPIQAGLDKAKSSEATP